MPNPHKIAERLMARCRATGLVNPVTGEGSPTEEMIALEISAALVSVRGPKPAPVIRESRNTAAPNKRKGRVVAKRMHIRTDHGESVLCFCLPADAASLERMVEQDARAMMKLLGSWEDTTESHRNQIRALARAALASKGIKAKGGRP